jgi:hypothetical protein
MLLDNFPGYESTVLDGPLGHVKVRASGGEAYL